jgi:hypothetical protein
VVGGLDEDAAGRFLLEVPPFRRFGGVLVGPADGQDVHVSGDQINDWALLDAAHWTADG